MSNKIIQEFVIIQHNKTAHGQKCPLWSSKQFNVIRYADDRELTADNIVPLFNALSKANPGFKMEGLHVWANYIEINRSEALNGFKTVRKTIAPRSGY